MTEFETKLLAVLEKIASNTWDINSSLYDISKDLEKIEQTLFEKE